MTAQQIELPTMEQPAVEAVRQWTKNDLFGLTLICHKRGETELSNLIWQLLSPVKGKASTVVRMPDPISRAFDLLERGELP